MKTKKFSLKEMVSFGNFLLDKKRAERFKEVSKHNLNERLSFVHDADIQNWKEA